MGVYNLFYYFCIIFNTLVDESYSQNSTHSSGYDFHYGDGMIFIPDGSGNTQNVSFNNESTSTENAFESDKDTFFALYTVDNPEDAEILILQDLPSIQGSNFTASIPTRIIIHGWTNDINSPVNTEIRSAYLTKGEFNVIVVDWSKGSKTKYPTAVSYVKNVGETVAKFIDFLSTYADAEFDSTYVIGHSLGAHIAGFTGKYVQKGRLPVIYGLDPALPLFSTSQADDRLDATDADYVEIIHTNAGIFGFDRTIGTADFYLNYGTFQPGCGKNIIFSHNRAYEYFAESINTEIGFLGRKCDNVPALILLHTCIEGDGEMQELGGEPSRSNRTGVYNVITNSESPYAKVRDNE